MTCPFWPGVFNYLWKTPRPLAHQLATLRMKIVLWPPSSSDDEEQSPHCLQRACSNKQTRAVLNLRSVKALFVAVSWHNLTDTQALRSSLFDLTWVRMSMGEYWYWLGCILEIYHRKYVNSKNSLVSLTLLYMDLIVYQNSPSWQCQKKSLVHWSCHCLGRQVDKIWLMSACKSVIPCNSLMLLPLRYV